jgi:GTPase Era involved in 16S rRNA processing
MSRAKKKKKCIVVFAEGATEIQFYKQIVQMQRRKHTVNADVIFKDIKGISKFGTKLQRTFENEILQKFSDYEIVAVLCYDADAFEFSYRPPANINKIAKMLKSDGAKKVICVKAIHSIEDWFLKDTHGICSYLHLKDMPVPNAGNGYQKLAVLYRRANKMYIKGDQSKDLIMHLNIELIVEAVKPALDEFINELT